MTSKQALPRKSLAELLLGVSVPLWFNNDGNNHRDTKSRRGSPRASIFLRYILHFPASKDSPLLEFRLVN